jgi:hypothetical protein
MNEQRNEHKMDELISRTINTEKPQFDAEEWRQKYPEEYQALLCRATQEDSSRHPTILKVILKSPLLKIAVAALIILGVSIFITQKEPGKQEQPNIVKTAKSPIEMMTAISLERAFQRGGIEAVEEQCKQAFKPIAPRSGSLPIECILAEFNINGKSSERTRQ